VTTADLYQVKVLLHTLRVAMEDPVEHFVVEVEAASQQAFQQYGDLHGHRQHLE